MWVWFTAPQNISRVASTDAMVITEHHNKYNSDEMFVTETQSEHLQEKCCTQIAADLCFVSSGVSAGLGRAIAALCVSWVR